MNPDQNSFEFYFFPLDLKRKVILVNQDFLIILSKMKPGVLCHVDPVTVIIVFIHFASMVMALLYDT